MPAETPNTTPVLTPTVATAVLPLLQLPPPASLSVIVEFTHTDDGPLIADGNGSTVSVMTDEQPVPDSLYTIVLMPADRPVTIPVSEPMEATVVLLLLHVPPAEVSLSATVAPIHTTVGPRITVGSGLTVTTLVTEHPTPSE